MRSNVFIKVVVEHEKEEKPEKLGAELCRQLLKNYIVRKAEVSNVSNEDES
jgi:phosphoribosylformylglycinamidine (FGAM) synthase PurS component